jgi:hypothetical protein
MALIDHIQNAVHKFIPQKKETFPKPLNTSSGGIGHGMQFDDEVRRNYKVRSRFRARVDTRG